jgi:predicted 3-demethylubiquinone-9 3-methyltransferase (glyoxalase superfamily)
MQKITPFLWFDNNAEEAMNFYVSIFKNSRIGITSRYGDSGPMPAGTFMVGTFYLDGQEFMALNGGPHYKLNPAFSMLVKCETQEEVDYYWDKLASDGGKPVQCGWLEDKFGLSWQIVPTMFLELVNRGDAEKTNRMMQALMGMTKLDIAELKRAYEGGPTT